MGGAGPLHACALARDLGIGRIIVPRHPGVVSAAGLLAAPVEHEVASAFGEPLAGLDTAKVLRVLNALDAQARRLMESEGVAPDDVEVLHFADVCHIGQGYYLEVPLDVGTAGGLERLYADFLAAHERVHGHAVDAPARFVNLRSVHRQRVSRTVGPFADPADAAGNGNRPRGGPFPADGMAREGILPTGQGDSPPDGFSAEKADSTRAGHACAGTVRRRMVRFPEEASRVETCIAFRDALVPGAWLSGPAIVEQDDTTTLIPPGWRALTKGNGAMVLSPEQKVRDR